ncbi:PIG-L family deacetylase [Paracoccus onubensis]|uniref:PIG-L deacetylase family protein n=1 Tax=Paracoccus onubensis TaxID=1675788 RepID=UPI00272EE9E8|nr:PIG-L family deacetylase [Paracoccus onubensis]MDP0928272.1 PIG-L family deacetylase [Paracoccus onubensis]
MAEKNPYRQYVSDFARLLAQGRDLPLGGFPAMTGQAQAEDAPTALIFAPHPDDECIIGGLPLRLLRELGYRIVNVAVTQGSREDRRTERWQELAQGCAALGFGLIATGDGGLTRIRPETREQEAPHWRSAVDVISGIITAHRPQVVFFPHDDDWNQTHIGTHLLLTDALRDQPRDFACHVVETEFWGAMDNPNLMVESGEHDVADLIAALSCHVGEVRRNPYHLRLPGWMIDNVRRGGELVMGQGQAAPDFTFATLYRLRRWQDGTLHDVLDQGRAVAASQDLADLFPATGE